ncbi:transposable element Tcb2 transposase [Trichonephila clavipes]|nr:transposable element Tcb2 transposase [Trichonephila clavipes]
MAPHTLTPAVGAVSRCKTKTGLRRSPRGLHTQTRLSSLPRLFVAKDDLVPFRCISVSSCVAPLQTEASIDGRQGRNGRRDPKCPLARTWNRFLETGSASRKPVQCRRLATTPNGDRYLVLTARRHRNMNATLLQQHLRSATGATVSTQTVRNRLHGVDLYAHRPMGDEILRPIVVPYAAAIGDDFILMDDNCRPHRANLVEDFLFEEGIVRMDWPTCSPDMNPIEHVWDALGRRVAGRQPPPQILQDLERALLEEWDRIPQLVINSLIDSMPQRGSTLLAVCGNHTPY